MTAEKIVVGLTGMPGSGKSLVVAAARLEGYDVVVMGDVVREETKKRGLELNPKNKNAKEKLKQIKDAIKEQ